MAKKATNSLEGVEGLAVQVNRVAAPVREQVFDQLRQAIVEMRLKPEQRLVERELIEQTGVSRTTIREVLRQLAAEGLVTTIPHKGTVVASPSVERAAELYEVRAVLEGMAARQFAERATDVHLRALRRAFEGIERRAKSGRPNSQAMLEAKRHFYDALFEGAANGTIQSLVESLQARVTVLRAASLSQPGRAAKTVEEVRAIVEALERRDGDAAAAACVHHVNEAARTVFEAMAAAEAAGLGGRAVALGGQLVEHDLGLAEGLEARGRAAVDGGLQQRLADLLGRAAVVDRAAHVRAELVHAAQRGQHPEVDQAARAAIEARARPHRAPAVLGHELLRDGRELRRGAQRAIDVLVAEHLAAGGQPALVASVGGAHRCIPAGTTPRRSCASWRTSGSRIIVLRCPAAIARSRYTRSKRCPFFAALEPIVR